MVEGAFTLSVQHRSKTALKTTLAHFSYCKDSALAIMEFLAMSYSSVEGERQSGPFSFPC